MRTRVWRVVKFAAIVVVHYALAFTLFFILARGEGYCLAAGWRLDGWCRFFSSSAAFGIAMMVFWLNPEILALALKLFGFSYALAITSGGVALAFNVTISRELAFSQIGL